MDVFIDYLEAIVAQAEDRGNCTKPSVREYLARRREDVGGRPAFVLGVLHLSIPDEAFNHPVIKELENAILDLIIVDNVSSGYTSSWAYREELSLMILALRILFPTIGNAPQAIMMTRATSSPSRCATSRRTSTQP